MRIFFVAIATFAVTVCAICPAGAALFTLTDQNSMFQIDPTADVGASVWQVDGLDHLFMQQWFYRLSSGGSVLSINKLGTPAVTVAGTDYVQIGYASGGFTVTMSYTLTGGSTGSGSSDIAATVHIQNLGDEPLQFTLFDYADFDLRPSGSPCGTDDSAERVSATCLRQWDSECEVSESVSRTSDRWQIVGAPFDITGDLSNSTSPTLDTDCAWALQWDMVVPVGGSVAFSRDQTILHAPEPSSLLALASCLAGMCAFRRRKR